MSGGSASQTSASQTSTEMLEPDRVAVDGDRADALPVVRVEAVQTGDRHRKAHLEPLGHGFDEGALFLEAAHPGHREFGEVNPDVNERAAHAGRVMG